MSGAVSTSHIVYMLNRVGIQVRLKWCAIDYYLILRHVQTTQIGQNLLTNLQQPRRIYARNCNYDRPESQPCISSILDLLISLQMKDVLNYN